MRRKRNNNKAIDLYRHSNTYVLKMFGEFEFFPINMQSFFDL